MRHQTCEYIRANHVAIEALITPEFNSLDLRRKIEPNKSWTDKGFMVVQARMHHLNIFLLELVCLTTITHDDLPLADGVRPDYAVTLLTPTAWRAEDVHAPVQPVRSERNCICLLFHRANLYKQKRGDPTTNLPMGRGSGHFEYIVDQQKRSLWHVDDPIIQHVLMEAVVQYRSRMANERYRDLWKKSSDKGRLAKMDDFSVGDVALLLIDKPVMDACGYKKNRDGAYRHMPVKLIQEFPTEQPPRKYYVNTYAGILDGVYSQAEMRAMGQNIATELKQQPDPPLKGAKRVPLQTAYQHWLARQRAAHHLDSLTPTQRQQLHLSTGNSTHTYAVCNSCLQQTDMRDNDPLLQHCCQCNASMHVYQSQCPNSSDWTYFNDDGVDPTTTQLSQQTVQRKHPELIQKYEQSLLQPSPATSSTSQPVASVT